MSNYEQKLKTNLEYYHRNKKRLNANRRKDKVTIVCEYKKCGKEKETSKPNQRFCSDTCRQKFNYEEKSKLKQASKQKALTKITTKKATNKNKKYTRKELKYIEDNFEFMTVLEISLKLKRPHNGVVYKLGQIKKEIEINKFSLIL